MQYALFLADLLTNTMASATSEPGLAEKFGSMFWPLLAASGAALAVIVERLFHLHRVQINSVEFLNGVRTVLKSGNTVEAIAICDATPGPVARLTKAAVLARDAGRARVEEVIDEVSLLEVPRLEMRLGILATLAQIAPLMGLLGTLFGFIRVFRDLQSSVGHSAPADLFRGVWQALYASAGGIAIAIVCYAAYNYLVGRVSAIVLDMRKSSGEVIRLVGHETISGGAKE